MNTAMAEQPVPLIYNNVLPWRGCEKLYLDTRTADVFFVFKIDDENTVKLPAHKSILSVNSDAFDAMFYGSRKQEGDIPIVDSTPEAFKEFLQFFYLRSVKLSDENVAHVMNLGKQYLVDECCMASSNFTKQTLTLDTMCWGYELAILFDQRQLMQFCEKKIGEHPKEIFESSGFLSCGSKLLARILQLDTFNCEESVVFDGCMAWAKAACIRNGLDETNMQNIRNQLGDLFYEIRFGDMTTETFHQLYRSYDGLFSIEELMDIMGMIASKKHRPPKFNRNARKMDQICKLNKNEMVFDLSIYCLKREKKRFDGNSTIISSNSEILLKTIHCEEIYHYDREPNAIIPTILEIVELSNERPNGEWFRWDKKLVYSDKVIIQSQCEPIINLSKPLNIRPDFKYRISFQACIDGFYFVAKVPNTTIQMDNDAEINIHGLGNDFDLYPDTLITKIIFVKPEE